MNILAFTILGEYMYYNNKKLTKDPMNVAKNFLDNFSNNPEYKELTNYTGMLFTEILSSPLPKYMRGSKYNRIKRYAILVFSQEGIMILSYPEDLNEVDKFVPIFYYQIQAVRINNNSLLIQMINGELYKLSIVSENYFLGYFEPFLKKNMDNNIKTKNKLITFSFVFVLIIASFLSFNIFKSLGFSEILATISGIIGVPVLFISLFFLTFVLKDLKFNKELKSINKEYSGKSKKLYYSKLREIKNVPETEDGIDKFNLILAQTAVENKQLDEAKFYFYKIFPAASNYSLNKNIVKLKYEINKLEKSSK